MIQRVAISHKLCTLLLCVVHAAHHFSRLWECCQVVSERGHQRPQDVHGCMQYVWTEVQDFALTLTACTSAIVTDIITDRLPRILCWHSKFTDPAKKSWELFVGNSTSPAMNSCFPRWLGFKLAMRPRGWISSSFTQTLDFEPFLLPHRTHMLEFTAVSVTPVNPNTGFYSHPWSPNAPKHWSLQHYQFPLASILESTKMLEFTTSWVTPSKNPKHWKSQQLSPSCWHLQSPHVPTCWSSQLLQSLIHPHAGIYSVIQLKAGTPGIFSPIVLPQSCVFRTFSPHAKDTPCFHFLRNKHGWCGTESTNGPCPRAVAAHSLSARGWMDGVIRPPAMSA